MISGMNSSRGTVICALAIALGGAPSAGAAVQGQPLGGTITIAASEGKDQLAIELDGNAQTMTVEPAVTVTATSGSCPPNTDPLTGRPTITECRLDGQTQKSFVVDLRGGDDAVQVADQGA